MASDSDVSLWVHVLLPLDVTYMAPAPDNEALDSLVYVLNVKFSSETIYLPGLAENTSGIIP
ncbi:MAG: hypothetical protein JSW55_11235 [Chloroflexota bacterium]|nr:MAG: hypothetical protein JSW55_11235 [Chloroflexota bacterium]